MIIMQLIKLYHDQLSQDEFDIMHCFVVDYVTCSSVVSHCVTFAQCVLYVSKCTVNLLIDFRVI